MVQQFEDEVTKTTIELDSLQKILSSLHAKYAEERFLLMEKSVVKRINRAAFAGMWIDKPLEGKRKKIIKKENPDTLILLGDVKSSIQNITKTEWNDVPYFFEEIKNSLDIILIPGNHDSNIDRLIPNDVTLIGSKGMIIDDILLTHGHTMPSKNYSNVNNIIMGHIHPVYFDQNSLLNGERIWISIKTEKSKIFPSTKGNLNITIIPSFNPYFYATEKRYYKKSISPIVEKIKDSTMAKILTLDGTIIGNESIIDQVL